MHFKILFQRMCPYRSTIFTRLTNIVLRHLNNTKNPGLRVFHWQRTTAPDESRAFVTGIKTQYPRKLAATRLPAGIIDSFV